MASFPPLPSASPSGPQLLLPAPKAACEPLVSQPVVDIKDVLAACGSAGSGAPLAFVLVDEFHPLLPPLPPSALWHLGAADLSGVAGTDGPSSPSARAPNERRTTKRVTLSGDDGVLAQWEAESDLDWTVLWQTWVPPAPGIALARVRLLEESEAGLQLAVDVGMTCEELAKALGNRFPTLSVEVVAQPTRESLS